MRLRGRAALGRAKDWAIWDREKVGLRLGWAHVVVAVVLVLVLLLLGMADF
jgi:hypothetical protein